MKQKFIPVLLLILISLFIQGCGSSTSNPNEIVIWHQMRVDERIVLEKQLKEFEKLHPGIKVIQLYKETEELRSGYIISSIGGQGPDLVYSPSDNVGPFEEMKIIKPLDEVFDEEYFSKFTEQAVVRKNGKPWMIADKLGNHLTLVYNKKLVPKPPATDKELIQIGLELTKDINNDGRPDQYGIVWNYTEPFFFIPFYTGYGGWVIDSLNNPTLNNESMIKSMNFLAELKHKYKIIPGESDYDIAETLFKEERAGIIINGDWSWAGYGRAGIDYGITPLPLITETGLYASPMVAAKGFCINRNVDEVKLLKLKMLLEFLLSPEKQLETALEVKTFPTRNEIYDNELLLTDEILVNSKKQIELGTPMPIVTEMRVIWDAMRPHYQAVLGSRNLPSEAAFKNAAQKMQSESEYKISQLRDDKTNPLYGLILQIFFVLIALAAIILLRKSIIAFIQNFKKDGFAYVLALPALIIMLAVIFYPFVYNIILSFSNMNLRYIDDWSIIGFAQYLKVFSEPRFYEMLLKTLIWTFTNIFFHVTIGVLLALLLNRDLPGRSIYRLLLILPWAIPQYITALTWRGMFNYEYGAINLLLTKYLMMSPIEWLKSPVEAFSAIIITNVWLGFPFMMVIALGALQSIPQELYEAADIDGAKWYHKLKNITIPLIKPVMIPAITLGTVWTFNQLNVVWLVSNAGEPSDKTHILVSYVYKAAFNMYDYAYAAAFSMVIFLILLLFSLVFIKKTKATESVY